MKKIISSVVGAVASYYASKFIIDLLERKPLKTRVRECQRRVIDVRDQTQARFNDVSFRAKQKVHRLIEERPADDAQA